MKSNRVNRIEAFTILEVVIVVAIMGILISVFFGALNRYGEQLKREVEIKNELNHWFLVRSNLWKEYDQADSMVVINNTCIFLSQKRRIEYSIKDQKLFRSENRNVRDIEIVANKIEKIQKGKDFFTIFNILWKGEEMIVSFPTRQSHLNKINTYFVKKEWK